MKSKISFLYFILFLFLITSCLTPKKRPKKVTEPQTRAEVKDDVKDEVKDEVKSDVKNELSKSDVKIQESLNLIESVKVETNNKFNSLETQNKDHEIRLFELENAIKKLNAQTNDLSQDNFMTKKSIAILKNDINSLNEILITNKRDIDIIKRGLRSGVYDDFDLLEKKPPGSLGVTMLPDLNSGRDGYSEKTNSLQSVNMQPITTMPNEKDGNPQQMLTSAEKKMKDAQYSEALNTLSLVKKNFPNFQDDGRVSILSSEAWLRLGQYNNVLQELQSFYQKNPNSPNLAHAKLLEGLSFEMLNSKAKAAQLYQEVISLSPQSMLAQNAREAMLRMRDSK
ncbi:MAG: outer membrane protein assembly factor BamD [Spirobacillus cienkowskii]|jgi:TolA-binding protein|uniref:Outer membrane protein assembly factor BamD n=1 Tax=Spirobacillus cienkowskii TaxID=495820 RepID=A0A369KTY4_9BACT|nr:MAG: outer membrane protein assembly factor BamD [Spirobacillus cienkowskii]